MGKRVTEGNGQLGSQASVVRHERPGERGLVKMITKTLGEILQDWRAQRGGTAGTVNASASSRP